MHTYSPAAPIFTAILLIVIIILVFWIVFMQCKPAPSNVTELCSRDADCNPGFYCASGGFCLEGSGGRKGEVCDNDATCVIGLRCLNGRCEMKENGSQLGDHFMTCAKCIDLSGKCAQTCALHGLGSSQCRDCWDHGYNWCKWHCLTQDVIEKFERPHVLPLRSQVNREDFRKYNQFHHGHPHHHKPHKC